MSIGVANEVERVNRVEWELWRWHIERNNINIINNIHKQD